MTAKKAAKKKAKKKTTSKKAGKTAAKRATAKKTSRKKAGKTAAKRTTAKKAGKTAAKKTSRKKTAKKSKGGDKGGVVQTYRVGVEERLDVINSESMTTGEELWGAIGTGRKRYKDAWLMLRRRQMGIRSRLRKLRPGKEDVLKQMREGIDADVKALETWWKGISKEVDKAIKVLK